MSPDNEQILIDYLDKQLEGEAHQSAEQLIREDAAAAQELEYLQFSVELIRDAAVNDQVAAARTAFAAKAKVIPIQQKETGAVVRSFSKTAMRIAATALLLVGSATLYKYAKTNSLSVYDQNFTSFELSTSRGNDNDGELEKAYRNKNWVTVENIVAGEKEKNIKPLFLSGMAEMELKNYNKAIGLFNEVIQLNQQSTVPYFKDEAEYYLAMSYLAADKPAEGVRLLRKIRTDKEHLFYSKASAIPALDLKLLELKK